LTASRSQSLGAPEDLDDHPCTRPRDARGLAERRDHVVGEEERAKAGDEVEAAGAERQRLQVAEAQVGLRHPYAREGEQALARVDPGNMGAAVGAQVQEHAGAAAEVERAVAPLEPHAPQGLLVHRGLLLLAERPGPRPVAPQGAPMAGAHAHLIGHVRRTATVAPAIEGTSPPTP
jgi:hypothetical protein